MGEKFVEDVALALRESFKLSSYEARIYLSLLKLGRLKPKQISSNSRVPLPRVYDTLESLMSKGFVLKHQDSYSPISPRKALRGRSLQFDREFREEEKIRSKVESELVAKLEHSQIGAKNNGLGEISVLNGFNGIANKFSELLEFSSNIVLIAKRAVEAKEVFIPLLLEFAKGKKKIRILLPRQTEITNSELAQAKTAKAEVRKSDNILFDMMIADNKDVIIGVPDPLSDEINRAIAIWVRNASFAKSTTDSFEEIWKSAQKVP